MRKFVVLAVVAVLLAGIAMPARGQVAFEAGMAVNVLTTELIPKVKAQLGSVLATYLVQNEPNLTLSLSVAKFGLGEFGEANLRAAGGFELFLGPDGLPNGGQGNFGGGFDVWLKDIRSRLEVQVLGGFGTRGWDFKPTIAVSIDVGAIIQLVQNAIDTAVKGSQ